MQLLPRDPKGETQRERGDTRGIRLADFGWENTRALSGTRTLTLIYLPVLPCDAYWGKVGEACMIKADFVAPRRGFEPLFPA